MRKIFLEGYNGKQTSNTSEGINVSLKGKRKLLPFNDVSETVSQYEQYTLERNECNKIRLICQVNVICSNVLFNRITEVVKDEGSDHVSFVNYGIDDDGTSMKNVLFKPTNMDFWSASTMNYISLDSSINGLAANSTLDAAKSHNSYDSISTLTSQAAYHPTNAIRDTQLSDNNIGYVYHCGLDIFNNHLLRSNTFKTVCPLPSSVSTENSASDYTAFNTIADIMRDAKSNKVVEKLYFPIDANVDGNAKIALLHLYEYDDILPFADAISECLVAKYNGWVGFDNTSKTKTYKDFSNDEEMEIERPIQYMNGGDFIDMYPDRELYSFVPKYNQYRRRIEKNWNYCISYPSSSFTPSDEADPFSDIIDISTKGMKAIYFDENTRADNGTKQLVIYSIAKHGLQSGDYVNIYETHNGASRLLIAEAEVNTVVDDYIFTVFNAGVQISSSWIMLSDEDKLPNSTIEVDGVTYMIDDSLSFFKKEDDDNRFYIVNGSYVNFDSGTQHISYKKTIGGVECEYYVRIFSKLPNFKCSSGNTFNEYEIYKDNGKIINEYQDKKYDFANQVSRLAFAKNIYTDDIGEVVFTDDIDLSYLHDNLGRPLSMLYFTIIKNNHGYKEWYGFGYENDADWNPKNINDGNVEFSHCFGKITCGLPTCDESMHDSKIFSINRICNISDGDSSETLPYGGYDVSRINERKEDAMPIIYQDEIWYDTDKNFYGDICCYDGYNAMEYHIDYIYHRFTPAQRECVASESADYFEAFNYDEITHDDYDISSPYTIASYSSSNSYKCNDLKEGYYYCPFYEIPIREFGNLQTIMPDFLSIRQIKKINDSINEYEIVCRQQHFLSIGDKAIIYDKAQDKYFTLTAVQGENDTYRTFTCLVTDEETGEAIPLTYVTSIGTEDAVPIEGVVTTATEGAPLLNYRLFKTDNLGVPSYASLLKDGTCRYVWRDVINNGMNGDASTIEQYPFTNGAFYVNKKIDLYVRRQDPYDMYGLYDSNDIVGNSSLSEEEDNYVQENDIIC